MKHTLSYTLIALFLLSSCQQEDSSLTEIGKGYLSLTSIEVQSEDVTQIGTRAVDADLAIQILSEDEQTTVQSFDAGAAEASAKIELDPGTYYLVANSTNYGTILTNEDAGTPVYYLKQAFTIESEKVNYLEATVPMTNFGVKLTLPDAFDSQFSSYTFTVSLGDRTVTLQNGGTAYFDVPTTTETEETGTEGTETEGTETGSGTETESGSESTESGTESSESSESESGSDTETTTSTSLIYTLSVTNTDSETFTSSGSYSTLSAGKLYEITYSYATRSLSCQ